MSERERERWHADLILRVTLDAAVTPGDIGAVDWAVLTRLARRNAVLLRLTDALGRLGYHPPRILAEAAAAEWHRVRGALALVSALDRACTRHGIPHVFPKVAQHHPDLGSDVDLLVLSDTPAVDALVLSEVRAVALGSTLGRRIAGTTAYRAEGAEAHLDIHHARLGRFGEQAALAQTLVRRRQRVAVGAIECFVPSPEHQLVLQGLDRVLGHRSFRLADVLHTIMAGAPGTLDWDDVVRSARAAGVQSGLACYLRYAEQIHARLFGRPLLPAAVSRDLAVARRSREGRVEFRAGAFRFPALRVNGRLYLEHIAAEARAGRWGSAVRLCLCAAVGAATGWRQLVRAAAGGARAAGTAP